MTLPIISADERLKEQRGIKGCIVGKSGIGKTSLLWTLDPKRTLFVDLEAGDLAVEGWAGDTLRPRTWGECRDLAVYIGGPNPSLRPEQCYSQAHYDMCVEAYGGENALDQYDTIFFDSITVAGRLCFNWCKGQSQAFSEKTGKEDMRGAYGLQGQEMVGWLTQLQHTRNKNIWLVGILDEKTDDFNRRYYELQTEGSKTSLELPGIFDQIITMAEMKADDGSSYRAFICTTLNDYGMPAKDRSGRLEQMEKPNLGELMVKIRQPAENREQSLAYSMPPASDDVLDDQAQLKAADTPTPNTETEGETA